eukprot:TRINITY_DN990_c0_g1_i4.p1 TRINITY_DN990_c0_g1~~TRINITY_DN990_c0_g1_i4.p1  ORF type:complete len:267 (-),score=77.72 TRINITY_DN990_c0_g1_i4:433-1233(-)
MATKFYCCYLLTSLNPKYKNHTYIGFTVNPKRRIRQHNGEITKGAKKTKLKRPWRMVLFISGFPTNTVALQFEWTWQHPTQSSRTKSSGLQNLKNIGSANLLRAKIRFLYELVHLSPWNHLPLTINWLTEDYHHLLTSCPDLPKHITTNITSLEALDDKSDDEEEEEDKDKESSEEGEGDEMEEDEEEEEIECMVCEEGMERKGKGSIKCVGKGCGKSAHVLCLAREFLKDEEKSALMPTTGKCPSCKKVCKWADLIKVKKKELRG